MPGGAAGVSRSPDPGQLHRIVLTPNEVRGDDVLLSAANTHHVREVLRLRHRAFVRGLVAESGPSARYDLLLRLEDNWEGRLHCLVVGRVELPPDPRLAITVGQGLTRGERFEYTLQKCTEIGAAEIVPLLTERTVVRPESVERTQRLARWQRIVEEAALQSGRGSIPAIGDPVKLTDFAGQCAGVPADLRLVAYESERGALHTVLASMRRQGIVPLAAQIVIGPEGGLASREVDCLVEAGFTPVSLGPRILRTETAGPLLTALLLYEFADLGGPGGA